MSDEFEWETPPDTAGASRGRSSKVFTEEIQEALKSHPGKWMVLIKEATSSNVSNAQAWAKKRDGYRVTSRTVPAMKDTKTPFKVYACFDPSYVPDSDNDDATA